VTTASVYRYVFCYTKGQKIGQRITESGFNKAWREARTAAGCPVRHDLPKGVSTMSHEDFEGVLPAIQTIEKFAGRLPEGDVEGHIRRSAHELTLAGEQRCGVEAACERLTQAMRQLDEHNTTGRLRRDFENEAPSVTRLLEAIQEHLVPALRRAGYQV